MLVVAELKQVVHTYRISSYHSLEHGYVKPRIFRIVIVVKQDLK